MNTPARRTAIKHDPVVCGLPGEPPPCQACRVNATALALAEHQRELDVRRRRRHQAAIDRLAEVCGVARGEMADVLLTLLGDDITDIAVAVAQEVVNDG